MSGSELLGLVIVIFIGIPLLSAYIYGLILAIRLMFKGEWQWFCLPFIAVPSGIVGKIAEIIFSGPMPLDKTFAIVTVGLGIMIVLALLSGSAVYWLMWRYRKETSFVHFYAASYFLCAALLAALLAAIFAGQGTEFFAGLLKIMPLYGFIVTLAGVKVMRGRIKLHKQNRPEISHKNVNIPREPEKSTLPWQEV